MRISELSQRSGVPVATIKYYLREGLLPAGELSSRTQASYGETHLRRLGLVRALVDSAGLSIARTREVLAAIDRPQPLLDLLSSVTDPGADHDAAVPRARALADEVGWGDVESGSEPMARLEETLAALDAAGFDLSAERLRVLARLMDEVAAVEVAGIPVDDPAAATEYVLVGTALVGPVLLALREVGHVHHSIRRFGGGDAAEDTACG